MNNKSYLMPFEEVVKMLISRGLGHRLPEVMKLRAMPPMRREDYPLLPRYQECWERFRRTWWEVCCPPDGTFTPAAQVRCFYVADSLRDAVRLRPAGQIEFWSCSLKEMESWLDAQEDWTDDPDVFEGSSAVDQVAY